MKPTAGRPVVPGELTGRRPTWIEVDLDALVANFHILSALADGRQVWCVVKADAYGHGAVACGRALEKAGAAGLVVALPEEGLTLRQAGLKLPILLSGQLPSGGAATLVQNSITPAISREEDLLLLEEAATAAGKTADFQLELDTGMTRMGLDPDQMDSFLNAAAKCSHCSMQAIFTHLASVANPSDDHAQAQHALFTDLTRQVRAFIGRQVPCHMASSPSICGFSPAFHDMIRPGLLLYGVSPAATLSPPPGLQPVLSFHTEVILKREILSGTRVGYEGTWQALADSTVVVIGAGYADGLRRDVSGKAHALVDGNRLPYAGSVNMDLAQLDASTQPSTAPGDVVTIIGRNGQESITVEELAECTGRTPYEWLTGLGSRVPRILKSQERP